jgi:hypothetical protein
MLFGNLPKRRADALLKTMNTQLGSLSGLLGNDANAVLGGPAKISLYVFNDAIRYAEFVRSVESREVDLTATAHGNLADETPYLAAIDPHGGGDEPAPPRRNEPLAVERSLAGLLSEQLGAEAVRRSGSPPRWLILGLGAYLSQRVEPNSPYYNRLRRDVYEILGRGEMSRVQELMGGQGDEAQIRAVGFGLLEWIGTAYQPTFTPFVRAMVKDSTRFDDVIRQGYGTDRSRFLSTWGTWAVSRYGRRR